MRVLLIEDDPGFRRLCAILARRAGYITEEAETVDVALSLLQKYSFNLITLDLELPDGTGLQVYEQILSKCKKHTTIVIVTANSNPNLITECQSMGLIYVEKRHNFSNVFQQLLERAE